jgi:hypothetical protein
MRKYILLFLISLCFGTGAKDWSDVVSQPRTEELIFEQCNPDSIASFTQIGASFDRYLSDTWYVGGTALGAVAGGRGGYATGAFQTGLSLPISPTSKFDLRFLIGGSGGGGVPVHGGLFIQPMIGFQYMLLPGIAFKTEWGRYISLDNSYQAWITDIVILFEYDHLFIPAK